MRTFALLGIIAVFLRAATLVCQSVVIGGIVFHRWVAASQISACERRPGILLVRTFAAALAAAQLASLSLNTAILRHTTGMGLAAVAKADFFIVGLMTIAAALAIAGASSWRLAHPGISLVSLSLVVLACGVLTSHAFSRIDGRAFLTACTAVHLGALAIWIGGLPQVWMIMRRSTDSQECATLKRFSRFAMGSVLALVASGFALSLRYIDSPSAIYGTSYGVMLAVKVLFFGVLLTIGAFNRRLLRSLEDGRSRLVLWRLLEAEIGIGVTTILVAASLTSQPPAVDIKAGRATAGDIYQRMKPAWPRLASPSLGEVSASTLQATKEADRAGLPPPPVPPNTLGDIGWSEYNHHWAGIFVLLMGLLGMLAHRRGFRPVRYWPLMLVGLAALIFLRADPEGWPLGPDSFWESIQNGEVMQHKASALLVLVFAVFELRVQLGKAGAHAAHVFPAVCALGGALLLTHAHGLNDVKQQLLAELSHAAIAIAAVLAGWSRWLQVRLPAAEGTLASRIWPVCFVVIGAVLLNYREI